MRDTDAPIACPTCGYDLRATVESGVTCPECGSEHARDALLVRRPHERLWIMFVCFTVPSIAAAVAAGFDEHAILPTFFGAIAIAAVALYYVMPDARPSSRLIFALFVTIGLVPINFFVLGCLFGAGVGLGLISID